ncbi:MAG: GAF domain-containing protein [Solirubrobacteraceae bacterium]|nr:GAF domain-containing protein [Solirubrobacteraceae bacterium]
MDEHQYRQLLTAGRQLVETTDTERLLRRLLEVARELTGARYAALGVLDDERRALKRFVVSGIDEDVERRIGDLPHGRGVLGVLIRDPQPLRLSRAGDHPRSFGFPPGHPPMESFLGVPIVIGGEPFGNLYLTEKPDGDFDAADEEALVVVASWAAVAIRNAALHDDLTARHDELQRAVETLEATTTIARALAGETDLDRVLELIAKRGRAVVDARSLLITLVDGEDIVVVAGAGEAASLTGTVRLPLRGTGVEQALAGRRTLRFSTDDGGSAAARSLSSLGVRAQTGLIVPLVFRNRPIGTLVALDRIAGGPFTEDEERVLEGFAVSAATAVGTAQSVTKEHRRRSIQAAEEERRRWARELHDDTLQELAAMRIGLARDAGGETVDELREAMQRAKAELDGRIAALRALITDLRPAALDQLGTVSALESLVARMSGRGLEVHLRTDLDWEQGRAQARHVAELEDGVYRLVQEALTNALHHADATRADVVVVERDGCIELTVTDDGHGFDTSEAAEGFGLLGMRERAELLDGNLEVESDIGKGTMIRAIVPSTRFANVAGAPSSKSRVER